MDSPTLRQPLGAAGGYFSRGDGVVLWRLRVTTTRMRSACAGSEGRRVGSRCETPVFQPRRMARPQHFGRLFVRVPMIQSTFARIVSPAPESAAAADSSRSAASRSRSRRVVPVRSRSGRRFSYSSDFPPSRYRLRPWCTSTSTPCRRRAPSACSSALAYKPGTRGGRSSRMSALKRFLARRDQFAQVVVLVRPSTTWRRPCCTETRQIVARRLASSAPRAACAGGGSHGARALVKGFRRQPAILSTLRFHPSAGCVADQSLHERASANLARRSGVRSRGAPRTAA